MIHKTNNFCFIIGINQIFYLRFLRIKMFFTGEYYK